MPKSKHQVPGRVRTAYELIKANRNRYSVQAKCRVLEVAPSGYYEWLLQPISDRGQEDVRLLRLIRASFTASHGIYGAPRVFLDLREAGNLQQTPGLPFAARSQPARAAWLSHATLVGREALGPDS